MCSGSDDVLCVLLLGNRRGAKDEAAEEWTSVKQAEAHLEVVAAQHNGHNVLANVMHVSLHGGDQDGAGSAALTLCLVFKDWYLVLSA